MPKSPFISRYHTWVISFLQCGQIGFSSSLFSKVIISNLSFELLYESILTVFVISFRPNVHKEAFFRRSGSSWNPTSSFLCVGFLTSLCSARNPTYFPGSQGSCPTINAHSWWAYVLACPELAEGCAHFSRQTESSTAEMFSHCIYLIPLSATQ